MYSNSLRALKGHDMPLEVAELSNLGRWQVSSCPMQGEKMQTFTVFI
jgi:hypothetical protein